MTPSWRHDHHHFSYCMTVRLTTPGASIAIAQVRGNYLTFFELQLADLSDDTLDKQMQADPQLRSYDAYIKETRKEKPHNLSQHIEPLEMESNSKLRLCQEVERALTVRSPYVGTGLVVDFYERELSKLRFTLDGALTHRHITRQLQEGLSFTPPCTHRSNITYKCALIKSRFSIRTSSDPV
eukprot:1188354-Prorocentrum_minimum.AAC.2